MVTFTSDAVARRAYELFLARGAAHGRDLDDWLEAERQLTGGTNGSAPNGRDATSTSTPRRRTPTTRAVKRR